MAWIATTIAIAAITVPLPSSSCRCVCVVVIAEREEEDGGESSVAAEVSALARRVASLLFKAGVECGVWGLAVWGLAVWRRNERAVNGRRHR